jgi:hypothetical protein
MLAVSDGRRLHPGKAVQPFRLEVNVSAHCRDTSLHLASENGHTKSLKALLEKGADVNAENHHDKCAFSEWPCIGWATAARACN